ncbi:MAG: polysulfide reductase NrfD [Coriobacteriales bacterium]|jgi:formate-dependent nitrite reductase membrane component NrfD|nr:polysulfide reductase NrfD [Coriobacteriales bacterium]
MSTFEPVWGPLIAGYLFLAGLGAGAFVFAFLLQKSAPHAFKIRRFAHILSPIAVVCGLVLLLIDATGALHNPLKLILLFSNDQSVMTWGVYFLIVFLIISVTVMVIDLKKNYLIPRFLSVLGVILSFCVALYTGVLLGVCNTFPLWNNALLPPFFLMSALSAGGASLLLYGALFAPEELSEVAALKKLQLPLAVIELLFLAALLIITSHNSSAGAASIAMLVAGTWSPWFWIGLVLCGLLLPIIADARSLIFSAKAHTESAALRYTDIGINVLALGGGFLLRFLIVMAAVPLAIAT